MEKMWNPRSSLGVITLCTILIAIPLFRPGYIDTHDGNYHLLRLMEMHRSIEDGGYYIRWVPDLNSGYGSPIFNFYPPLAYYVAELFHIIGFGFIDSIKATYFVGFLLSGIAMYLFARDVLGEKAGLVAAVAYIYAPYHLVDVYVRGAFGEFFSFVVIPMVLWSIYRLANTGDRRYVASVALFYALLITIHNVNALIFTPIFLLYILFLHSKERHGFVKSAFLAMLYGIGLSAFYWLPAVYESQFIQIYRVTSGYFDYHLHFVYPKQLFSQYWGYGYSVPGIADEMPFQIGTAYVMLSLLSAVLIKRAGETHRVAKSHITLFLVIVVVGVMLMIPASTPLWELLPYAEFIQFPWRILGVTILATSFLCGSTTLLFEGRLKDLAVVFLLLILILPPLGYAKAKYTHINESEWTPGRILESGSSATVLNDYLPITVLEITNKSAPDRISVVSGKAIVELLEHRATLYKIRVHADTKAEIRIDSYWFPGWKVYVDGREVETKDNKFGVIQLEVPIGRHTILIKFEDTFIRKVGKVVSYMSLLLLSALYVYERGVSRV